MSTNLVLANYANLALYAAMALLTLAMLAFAALVASTMPAPLAEAEVEVGANAEGVEARLAGVGVRAAAGSVAGSGVAPGAVRAGAADGVRRTVLSGPVTGALGSRAAAVAMSLTWLGTFLLLASVTLRGLAVSRVPVANMFEFSTFGAMLVLFVYLGLAFRWPIRWLGLFVVTPVLLTLGLALTVWYTEASELLPSLRNVWLAIHVPIATLSVALFTIAFAVLLLQLLKERRERITAVADAVADAVAGGGARVGAERSGGPGPTSNRLLAFFDQLPPARVLDRAAYSLHIAAFPLWTFSLIAGAIWAQQAWGTYWNWDPKEVWTFVIWVIYAAYLHARATSGWSIRTANILAVLGYVAIIINFTVVNMYFVGQHSYSGL